MPRYTVVPDGSLKYLVVDTATSTEPIFATDTEAQAHIVAFALNSVADGYQLAAIDPAKAFHFVSEYHDGCLYYEGPTEGVRS